MALSQETIEGLHDSILRDTEAARVLDRAAFRVEQGWTRGTDAENKQIGSVPPWAASAECWCARGAIIRATMDLGFTAVGTNFYGERLLLDATSEASSVRARAFGAAAHVILGQAPDAMSDLSRIVSHWNDHTALNGAIVARKLRAGARHIRRRIAAVARGLGGESLMGKYYIIGTPWDRDADTWADEPVTLWLRAKNVDEAIREVEGYGADNIAEQTFDVYDRDGETVAVMVDVQT